MKYVEAVLGHGVTSRPGEQVNTHPEFEELYSPI